MGKLKLNKSTLYIIVVGVLLFSLNLNTFSATSFSVHLADYYFESAYNGTVDCTSDTSLTSNTILIDGIDYNRTVIVFPLSSRYYDKSIVFSGPVGLYTNTNYSYKFFVHLGSDTARSSVVYILIYFYVAGEYHSNVILCSVNLKNGEWVEVSGTLKTPDLTGSVSCAIIASFTDSSDSNESLVSECRWSVTDILFSVDDPLINGTPINTPSTEELENTLNDYYDVMDSLPQVDENELADLMEFDFDSFSDGMSFVREMFERTMNVFGFNAVLVFGLTVGLATYIIGRKVG